MGLEDRLFTARRAQCLEHLVRVGQTPDQAERWCDAWEREAAARGRPHSPEFWDHGRLWIDAQIAARRSPDGVLARR